MALHSTAAAKAPLLLAGLGAAALAWAAVSVNMQRACAVQDTPYLPICAAPAADPAQRLTELRERIGRNPGDTAAYVQLAARDSSQARPALIAAASSLAPHDPRVRISQALSAVDRQDWQGAAEALVDVAEHYDIPAAPRALAAMVGAGQADLLAPMLTPGSKWLRKVMAEMPQAKAPLSLAVPLLARAHRDGVLDSDAVRPYLRELKAQGAWGDAYALWIAMRGAPTQLLFNAGFDEPLEADGFDWDYPHQPPARSGLVVMQPALPQRGVVLELSFTGRPLPAPVLRQHVFLGEGKYRLRGQYRTLQFRMDEGMSWAIQCTTPVGRASRSPPLQDTAGAWQPFDVTLTVPAGCGPVVSLQLEPHAAVEAITGARGRIFIDGLGLTRLAPHQR